MINNANDDAWTIAEGSVKDMPKMVRYRPNLKNFLGLENYNNYLEISWDFGEGHPNGMPSPKITTELQEFEDLLIDIFDHDRCAILAYVTTFDGFRVWNFYIKDLSEVGSRINQSFKPGLPIQIESDEDPDWGKLYNLLKSCKEIN